MKRACRNAGRLAEFLKNHPAINKVNYPGFKTHPSHQLASTQMSDYGAMVSFDLKKIHWNLLSEYSRNSKCLALQNLLEV